MVSIRWANHFAGLGCVVIASVRERIFEGCLIKGKFKHLDFLSQYMLFESDMRAAFALATGLQSACESDSPPLRTTAGVSYMPSLPLYELELIDCALSLYF